MPRIYCSEDSDSHVSKPAVVDLGGVWKKVYKRSRHEWGKQRPYPNNIHCRKCGKRILTHTWFYAKKVGNKRPHVEYYCSNCFEGLWQE